MSQYNKPSKRESSPSNPSNYDVRYAAEDNNNIDHHHAVTQLERKQNRFQYNDNNKHTRWGNTNRLHPQSSDTAQPIIKQQPNYTLTGLLQQHDNMNNNNKLQSDLYHEPIDRCRPDHEWRLYVYKDKQLIDTVQLNLSAATYYMIGRNNELCHIVIQHESCSKQHAVIQFRRQSKHNVVGDVTNVCKPYIIDLNSRNHTYLNKQQIEPQRYYELLNNDILTFGESTRKYVLINVEQNKHHINK